MSDQLTGFIPYGATDTSIVFRSPLTSLASIQVPEIGTGHTVATEGTGQTFDPVKGLKPGPTGSYVLNNFPSGALLAAGGQLRCQVETKFLACGSGTSEYSSGGVPQPGQEWLFSFLATPYSNGNYIGINMQLNAKRLQIGVGYGTTQATNGGGGDHYFSDAIGSTEWTDVAVTWSGSSFNVYINGVFFRNIVRLNTITAPFNLLALSRYSGGGFELENSFIRNFQVSTRPAIWPVHTKLLNVMPFGDSYSHTTGAWQAAGHFNLGKYQTFDAELKKRGYTYGNFDTTQNYGGRRVIGSGNAALYLSDNIPAAIARNPTYVIFQAGTNDLTNTGSLNATNFTAAMKSHIERFFGVNGNAKTTVQYMLINSTPWAPQYGNSSTVPNVAGALLRLPDLQKIRAIQAALPAWFNATYPPLAGRLIYQDTYAAYGSDAVNLTYNGPSDLLHPGAKGQYIMGKSWATGVIANL